MPENDLRKITLYDRDGSPQSEAYVHTCVTSAHPSYMVDNSARYELYYLSMYGPRGSATTLQSIFAALVTNSTIRDVVIDGIGKVALMHRSGRIHSLGFAPSWTCAYQDFGPGRALNAIVECPQLCYWDTEEAALTTKRRSSSGQQGKHREEKSDKAKRTGGVTTSTSADLPEDVAAKFERRPIFMLMIPAIYEVPQNADDELRAEAEVARRVWMEQLYLTYIDKRCPFPLLDDLAPFIWQLAMRPNPRISEELTVWSYRGDPAVPSDVDVRQEETAIPDEQLPVGGDAAPTEESEETDPPNQEGEIIPFLTKAFLCWPDLVEMMMSICAYIPELADQLERTIEKLGAIPASSPIATSDINERDHVEQAA